MLDLDLDELRGAFGLGVAGNFAGHLEQAGEAADFVGVQTAAAEAPKGIFPWYVPGSPAFLGTFPLSHDRLAKPRSDEPVNLQIEPEVGVLCRLSYDDAGAVREVAPYALAAFDDCSIRRPGAPKISHKKNWGPDSKGVAPRGFAVSDLDPEGPTAAFRLASFLRRADRTDAYGIDSPLPGYSYYGRRLLDWIADRLREQRADASPLEDVGALLEQAGRPATALVSIGATRYTPLGESTFLQAGDEAVVVVYDGAALTPDAVHEAVAAGEAARLEASVLCQTVHDAA